MFSEINITTIGLIGSHKIYGNIYLPFKDHKELLKNVESFFKTLLSVEHDNLRFFDLSCFNCGFCCKYFSPIAVSHAEILNLSTYINLTIKEFKEKYTAIHPGWPNEGRVLKDVPDESGKMTRCIFLKKEYDGEIYLCSVHPARPQACKSYKPSSIYPTCRELWKAKWEKINSVTLFPEEMIIYLADKTDYLESVKIKYCDLPVIMKYTGNIRDYVNKFIPSEPQEEKEKSHIEEM